MLSVKFKSLLFFTGIKQNKYFYHRQIARSIEKIKSLQYTLLSCESSSDTSNSFMIYAETCLRSLLLLGSERKMERFFKTKNPL